MTNITRVWIGNPYDKGHFNGTAFFIDEQTLVTAKHVVQDRNGLLYEEIFLTDTPDAGLTPVSDVLFCERDIALLKVKKSFKISKKNRLFTNALSVGDRVNVVGFYDKDSSQKSYENRVSGYLNREHSYELQNHLTHGLSGAPVLLEGKIAGVTNAINSSKNLTYVIPIEEVCQELEIDIATDEEVSEAKTPLTKKPLNIKEKVFNEIYSVRMPFIIILVLMVGLHKLIFTHGYALEDAMVTYIVFSYIFSKIFLYLRKKLQRRKDVS